jgi:ribosomal protein S27E
MSNKMSRIISCLKCGNDMCLSNGMYVCLACGDHMRAPSRGTTDITERIDAIDAVLGQINHRLGTAEQKIDSLAPLQREMNEVRQRMARLEERFKKAGGKK